MINAGPEPIFDVDGVLFDMDGVVTDTAEAHFCAWRHAFDDFLRHRQGKDSEPSLFERRDYEVYVDGKSRVDGIRSFLKSRDIKVRDPEIENLARSKNQAFHDWLGTHKVRVYPGSHDLIYGLRRQGVPFAVFTASKNADAVLSNAGLRDLIVALVDGHVAAKDGLSGKPAPDMLLKAASILGTNPERTTVLEDAFAGVEAGAAGGFRPIVAVAHGRDHEDFQARGADLVVDETDELILFPPARLGLRHAGARR